MGENMQEKSTNKNRKKHKKIYQNSLNYIQRDIAFQHLNFITDDKLKITMLWEKMR